jgi:hypothetical protein
MSLENLPGYLKSLKEKGSTGNAPVVDVGQISSPKRPYVRWLAAFVMLMALGVGGAITYDVMSRPVTVVVDIDKGVSPSQLFSQIASESEGQILAVKQTEESTYEIKVAPKNRHSFLEWLRKNKSIKKAELQD